MLSWRRERKPTEPGRESAGPAGPVPAWGTAVGEPTKTLPAAGTSTVGLDSRFLAPRKRLGEMLVDEGVVTEKQLAAALEKQKSSRDFLGQILVELGYVTQDTLIAFLVKQYKIPHINLLDYEINDSILRLIPEDLCVQYRMLPIDQMGKMLTVAMVDPLDPDALNCLRNLCPDLRIKPILCNWDHFATVAERAFKSAGGAVTELSAKSLGMKTRAVPPAPVLPSTAVPAAALPAAARPQAQPILQDVAVDAAVNSLLDTLRTEVAEEVAAATRTPSSETVPASAMATPTAEELASMLRDGASEAMKDAMAGFMSETQAILTSLSKNQPASPEELATALRDGVGDAVRQAVAPIAEQLAALAADDASSQEVSPHELATLLHDSVSAAMKEAMADFAAEQRRIPIPSPDKGSAPPPGPTPQELAVLLRDSVGDAVKQAMVPLANQMAIATKTDKSSPGVSPAELATIMRESVGGAMKEAVAALAQQVTAGPAAAGAQEALAAQTAQAGETAAAARHAIETMQQAIKANMQAQEAHLAQEARWTQLTDVVIQAATAAQEAAKAAATQAARAGEEASRAANDAETVLVAQTTRVDLQKSGQKGMARKGRSKVSAKAERNVVEALDKPGARQRTEERVLAALDSQTPLEGHTFDNFFTGQANAFTVKLSRAVAEKPGGQYNPFFLYGDVGLGKTHLINAIGNAVRERDEDKEVGYVSSSRFSGHVMEAIEARDLDNFRADYCRWDILILDDIQFLGGRIEAQEELFHIFNAILQENAQIIIAADKAPDRLGQLEKRLVSRFASGIVTSLKPPEWETRMAILRYHVKESQVAIPEDVLNLIASRVTKDIRKMTGALRKVIAFAGLAGQNINCDVVTEILGHLTGEELEN